MTGAGKLGRMVAVLCAAAVVGAGCGDDGSGDVGASPVPETTVDPSTTSAPPEDDDAAVDFGQLTYDAECSLLDEIVLVDGEMRPEAFNSDVETLVVTLADVVPLPGREDDHLVHLTCDAGGPAGALTTHIYVVMTDDGDGTATQRLALIGEADARAVVNDDGVVVVSDTVHGASDPSCCPSVERSRQIVWDDDEPVVVEGGRPDAPPASTPSMDGACVAHELEVGWADAGEVESLEQALTAAGFDPGPIDGQLDQATIDATVRLIEFNAGNPELRAGPDAPYDNLHAEASRHGTVREPVLRVLGVACDVVEPLPAN